MAVVSTPVRGRARLTYLDDAPDLRINGINPTTSAIQFTLLATALQSIQASTVQDGFLTIESELTEA